MHILSRSFPLFPKTDVILKPGEERFVPIKAPFIDDLSGMAMVKKLDLMTGVVSEISVKVIQNEVLLDVTK